jgi:hypothetical protein
LQSPRAILFTFHVFTFYVFTFHVSRFTFLHSELYRKTGEDSIGFQKWALYLPLYPNLSVEIGVGDRYKPDVVALGEDGRPLFWAEAGQVGG